MSTLKPAIFYPESPLLKDVAQELIDLYGEDLGLKGLNVDSILFVEDNFKEAKPEKIQRGEATIFDVKELHPAVAERLGADFMVIYYKLNGMKLPPEKLHAYFLEALMRINPLGGLRQPDVRTFSALALGLGPDWKRKQAIADVRVGELLKGSTVQQRLEFDNVVPMRRTGTERGA